MSLVALKCPNCGGSLDLEDSRDFAFCQYCGTKILIKEEIGRQRVVVDRSEELKNTLRLAVMSFSQRDLDKVGALADKALELDANCLDAWRLKIALAKAAGKDCDTLVELSSTCTNDMGFFSEDDYRKYLGSHVSFEYVPTGMLKVFDGSANYVLEPHEPIDMYLPDGPHYISMGPRSLRTKFDVNGDSGYTIDLSVRSTTITVVVTKSKLECKDKAAKKKAEDGPSLIRMKMPSAHVHNELKLSRFVLGTASFGPDSTATVKVTLGPASLKFYEICKKGFMREETFEYQLCFDAEKDASYVIEVDGTGYAVRKVGSRQG